MYYVLYMKILYAVAYRGTSEKHLSQVLVRVHRQTDISLLWFPGRAAIREYSQYTCKRLEHLEGPSCLAGMGEGKGGCRGVLWLRWLELTLGSLPPVFLACIHIYSLIIRRKHSLSELRPGGGVFSLVILRWKANVNLSFTQNGKHRLFASSNPRRCNIWHLSGGEGSE